MLNAVRIISTDEKGLFVIFKQSVMNQITPAEKNIALHVFIIAVSRNKVNKVIIGDLRTSKFAQLLQMSKERASPWGVQRPWKKYRTS